MKINFEGSQGAALTLRLITIIPTLLSATAAYVEPAQQPTFSDPPPCREIEIAQRLPVPKPPGPGVSCPDGYQSSGSFCTPSQDARDAIRQAAERHMSIRMDIKRNILPQQRQRAGQTLGVH